MKFGKFLWFLPIGLVTGLVWFLLGLVYCCTVVGAPIGKQCIKLSKLSFSPFGKYVDTNFHAYTVGNIVFLIIGGGFVTAVVTKMLGIALCITLIGIPFGLQFLKVSKLAWAPFGSHTIIK